MKDEEEARGDPVSSRPSWMRGEVDPCGLEREDAALVDSSLRLVLGWVRDSVCGSQIVRLLLRH